MDTRTHRHWLTVSFSESDPVSVSDGDEQKYCLSSPLLRTGCHPQTARAMCLLLDNHSIGTDSLTLVKTNLFIYQPGTRRRSGHSPPSVYGYAYYSHYHKCLSPTLHYIRVCYVYDQRTGEYRSLLCIIFYLIYNKMMFSFQYSDWLSTQSRGCASKIISRIQKLKTWKMYAGHVYCSSCR